MNEEIELKKSSFAGKWMFHLFLSDPEGAAAFANVSNYANSKHRDVKSSLN